MSSISESVISVWQISAEFFSHVTQMMGSSFPHARSGSLCFTSHLSTTRVVEVTGARGQIQTHFLQDRSSDYPPRAKSVLEASPTPAQVALT